ncbi:hypothetical protein [Ureibacillus chungkukjangi]|uniref:Uncharacterized protein n=1 Tax=Ureibacillus chungkukjangi TaxID=1202712 RepID=A0A318TPF0_9BACL|nr:hypothetical protein [Ureibacillus chungkukjangi]PYF06253.1 hypothetical protein BJ095_11184 [Ureibacillus chungkukjangi]
MEELIDSLLAISFLLNPILAVVFCLNLTSYLKKLTITKVLNTKGNIFWMCFASAFIVFTLTWMFAFIPQSGDFLE